MGKIHIRWGRVEDSEAMPWVEGGVWMKMNGRVKYHLGGGDDCHLGEGDWVLSPGWRRGGEAEPCSTILTFAFHGVQSCERGGPWCWSDAWGFLTSQPWSQSRSRCCFRITLLLIRLCFHSFLPPPLAARPTLVLHHLLLPSLAAVTLLNPPPLLPKLLGQLVHLQDGLPEQLWEATVLLSSWWDRGRGVLSRRLPPNHLTSNSSSTSSTPPPGFSPPTTIRLLCRCLLRFTLLQGELLLAPVRGALGGRHVRALCRAVALQDGFLYSCLLWVERISSNHPRPLRLHVFNGLLFNGVTSAGARRPHQILLLLPVSCKGLAFVYQQHTWTTYRHCLFCLLNSVLLK